MLPPAPRPLRAARAARAARALRRAFLSALLVLPLAGCEDLAPDRTRVLVRYQERAPLLRDRLVVTLRDGRREFYLEGLDLASAEEDGWWEARELRLGTSGQASVLVALRGTGQSPAAAGEVPLPLATNARWRLDVFASSADGAAACGDCAGFRRFLIVPAARPSAQDWLYVTWTSLAP